MDYFDCTYFAEAYFDVDPSCGAVSGSRGGRVRRIPVPPEPPEPSRDEDEDELFVVRLL